MLSAVRIRRLKRAALCHYSTGIGLAVLLCLAFPANTLAQKPAKPAAAKRPFVLTVKTQPILNISLKADKAKISEVADELSQKLKTPVFLGQQRQNETISVEFSELTLEPALQLMSPVVYVDYEIDTGSSAPPKALAIYLYDANQGEPPLTAVVNGSTQSLLIEGNTEDGVEPANDDEKKKVEEPPLRVSFLNNTLTVKAKKQPLALVLLKIGEELGVPVDIQNQEMAIVDADISKLPVEDALRQLSPHIRLFLRADLTRAEKRVLRLVLAEPIKTSQQNP